MNVVNGITEVHVELSRLQEERRRRRGRRRRGLQTAPLSGWQRWLSPKDTSKYTFTWNQSLMHKKLWILWSLKMWSLKIHKFLWSQKIMDLVTWTKFLVHLHQIRRSHKVYFHAQCKVQSNFVRGWSFLCFGIFAEMGVCAIVGLITANLTPGPSIETSPLIPFKFSTVCIVQCTFIRNCKKSSTCRWFKIGHCKVGTWRPPSTRDRASNNHAFQELITKTIQRF